MQQKNGRSDLMARWLNDAFLVEEFQARINWNDWNWCEWWTQLPKEKKCIFLKTVWNLILSLEKVFKNSHFFSFLFFAFGSCGHHWRHFLVMIDWHVFFGSKFSFYSVFLHIVCFVHRFLSELKWCDFCASFFKGTFGVYSLGTCPARPPPPSWRAQQEGV